MVYLLSACGYEALEAHEGAEGLQKARNERPDLILLDIHMPQMDGYEVARRLRADPECSKIPLVAVTALAMVGDREKILASGFEGYIAKPLDPESFAARVSGFIGLNPVMPTPPIATLEENTRVVAPPQAIKARILFADNSLANIELMRSTLEPSGYEVLVAHSVSEGLLLARKTRPDLIISDVHMPHEDGYEFKRRLQADPELSKVPFLFLSASVWSVREQDHALREGADKFLSRPIEPQVLLAEIEDCLNRRKRV